MEEEKKGALFLMRPDIESIVDLPLKTRYRALLWYGQANGGDLTLGFNIADIQKREVVIKSFAIYPYGEGVIQDFYVADSGATEVWAETIPALTRMNRIFDEYALGTQIRCLLNGTPTGLFQNDISLTGFPLDISFDNIFYHFPAKIETWNMQITAQVKSSLEGDTNVVPLVKVVVECYLL